MSYFSLGVVLLVFLYFTVQIVRDYRRKDFMMAGIGAICLAVLLLTPIPTHAVLVGPLIPN